MLAYRMFFSLFFFLFIDGSKNRTLSQALRRGSLRHSIFCSGDWIENLTALEYNNGKWSIYKYDQSLFEDKQSDEEDKSNKELFNEMLEEFNLMKNQ